MKRLQKWISIPAAALLLLPGSGQEQPKQVTSLHIEVLEGEAGTNIIKEKTAVQPVVEVRDQNNLPVAGVAVTFTLPGSGASGLFVNGGRTATVITDSAGRASTVFNPNNVAGQLKISVRASYQGQTASSTITQSNVAGSGESGARTSAHSHALSLGVYAGIVAVGAIVLGVHASGNSNRPTASIAPSGAVVGPPH